MNGNNRQVVFHMCINNHKQIMLKDKVMIALFGVWTLLVQGLHCSTAQTKSFDIKTVNAEESKCPTGYWRVGEERRCEACSKWTYGSLCEHQCKCIRENSQFCDHVTGNCRCKSRWRGSTCSTRRKTHLGKPPAAQINVGGIVCIVNCDSVTTPSLDILCKLCDSANTEVCGQSTSYSCQCKSGYSGTLCGSTCSAWKYGTGCGSDCTCVQSNTATCNNVNGDCTCNPGYSGSNCETACSAWKYGTGCGSDCTCVQANTATCNNVNGACTCNPGYYGTNCDTACSNYTYGTGCNQPCLCVPNNTLACNSVDGTCTCAADYTGSTCNETCPLWTYGNGCTSTCTCDRNNTVTCNFNGTCMCKPGYTGASCSQVCGTDFFGLGCVSKCACHENNSISCDHVTGYCTCDAGYDQPDCIQVCNPLTYGDQCSKSCSCPQNAYPTCNHVTGACTCEPGYVGSTCNTVCADNTFGINCIGNCDCAVEHTSRCDKATGVCVCNSGWQGTRCGTASAFALVDSPGLVGGLGFLAALVLAAIIILILWCACRCSYLELKNRSRRKKNSIELTEGPVASELPKGGVSSTTAARQIKTPNPKGLPNDNDGVYYGRDVLDNSSTPAELGTQVAPPVTTSGDDYYYTDGVAAAKAGKNVNPKGAVPSTSATTNPTYNSNSVTSSPRTNQRVIKTPLPLPPVAQSTKQPVYGNAGVGAEGEYANFD